MNLDIQNLEISGRNKKAMAACLNYIRHKLALERKLAERSGIWPVRSGIPRSNSTEVSGYDLIAVIPIIESILNKGGLTALCALVAETYAGFGVCFSESHPAHEFPLEFFEIWLRTHIARDKLRSYLQGIFKTQTRGDLRNGKFLTGKTQLLCALAKMEGLRRDRHFVSAVKEEVDKMDSCFFQNLGRSLRCPAEKDENLRGTKLQRFILNSWASECKTPTGVRSPLLCTCSDPVISKIADLVLGMNTNTPGNVRKTWERLGLQKMKDLRFWDVEVDKIVKGKVTISQFRRRSN